MNNNNDLLICLGPPQGTELDVVGSTSLGIHIKRPNGERQWVYWIGAHRLSKIQTNIPEEELENRPIYAIILEQNGNMFTLQVISRDHENPDPCEGETITITTKKGLMLGLEDFLERLSKSLNRISSLQADKNTPLERKQELLDATHREISKLVKVLKLANPVISEKEKEVIMKNLEDIKEEFPNIIFPKILSDLVMELGSFETDGSI
jgi:hypothetical protein